MAQSVWVCSPYLPLQVTKFIKDFGTTAIHAVPSYVTRLYEVMQEQGVDPRRDTKLKVLAIGAEPHSEEQRKRIEDMMGVKAYNSFGMSEMCGPGVGFECPEQNGLHFWEDYYIVEIVDPETLEPVPDGERSQCPMARLANWCSPRCVVRPCLCCAIAPATSPAYWDAVVPADVITYVWIVCVVAQTI